LSSAADALGAPVDGYDATASGQGPI